MKWFLKYFLMNAFWIGVWASVFAFLTKNWNKFTDAPLTFGICIGVGGLIGWFFSRWLYDERIKAWGDKLNGERNENERLNARIKDLQQTPENQPNKIKSDLNTPNNDHHSIELKTLRVINAIRRITDESRSRGWTYAQENVGQSMEDTERLMEQERRFFQNSYIEKCRNMAIACKRDLNDSVQQNMQFQVPEEYYINPHSLQDLDAIVTDLNNYLSLISASK